MATRYSLGVRTSGVTSATAAWEIRTSSAVRAFIKEIGIFLAAATASTYGLGRPGAIGVTPTSPVSLLAEDNSAAAASQSALAWGTGPTVPTNFFRRIGFPATIGSGVIWTFGEPGLLIPVSNSIVLWNLATNGVVDAYAVIEE
jgi:hypothetical protein